MLQLCCSVAALASKGEWSGPGDVGGEGGMVCVCVSGLSENGSGTAEGEPTNCVKEG